jgi:hypothetical protein
MVRNHKLLFWSLALLIIQIAAFPIVRAYSLYSRFWYTDVVLHIEAGLMFGLFWLWIIRRSSASNLLKYTTAITASVFGGFLWEVWELIGWTIVPGKTQNYIPDLGDSLSDIACGMLGAIILCAGIYLYKKFKK